MGCLYDYSFLEYLQFRFLGEVDVESLILKYNPSIVFFKNQSWLWWKDSPSGLFGVPDILDGQLLRLLVHRVVSLLCEVISLLRFLKLSKVYCLSIHISLLMETLHLLSGLYGPSNLENIPHF